MKLSLRLPPLRRLFANLRFPSTIRLPRREVLLVAAAGVLAAVVTLIVLVASFNAQERRASRPEAAVRTGTGPAQAELSVDDFLLPSVHPVDAVPDYYPFRPRLPRWSRENVEKFWVSPRQIATDAIGTINDRNMESIFEKVK